MHSPKNRLSEIVQDANSALPEYPEPTSGDRPSSSLEERNHVAAALAGNSGRVFGRDLDLPSSLARIARRREQALRAPKNTLKAWRHDWQVFVDFVEQHSAPFRPIDWPRGAWVPIPAPPELVAAFIDFYSPPSDDQLELGVSLYKADEVRAAATVRRYLATIGKAHRIHGLEDPTKDELVRDCAKAFFRGRGEQDQAAPIHWEDVAAFADLNWSDVDRFLASTNDEVTADQVRTALRGEKQLRRAQALLLVAYNSMARREELVALNLEDVEFNKDGDGNATIRKSKTDQAGEGQVRYLSMHAVTAIREWLRVAGITTGPLFAQFQRNGQVRLKDPAAKRVRKGELPALLDHGKRMSENEVNRTFKAAMRLIGKPSAEVAKVSGHSTRVGAAQDLRDSGMTLVELMNSGGWKDAKMPARYSRKQGAKRSGMAKMMKMKQHDQDGQ